MATNRKQPFGYRIVCGEIVPHESEAATVQWIFATYLAGASYSTLVGALQERGVPYDTGKPWNKNMVARILEDRRYIGEGGFPQILKQEQFNASQVSKQERVPPRHQTPAQKELRRLCGSTPPSWVEGQVLGLLNGLIENPDMISCTADAEEESEVGALRRQLDDALHSPPVEEAQIRSKHDWAVDYIITHCAPTDLALAINRHNKADPLTDFLQEIQEKAQYHYWLFGHYHGNQAIDNKHILLWEQIVQVI